MNAASAASDIDVQPTHVPPNASPSVSPSAGPGVPLAEGPAEPKPLIRLDRLRALRLAQELSQDEAGRLAGIGHGSWEAIEGGRYCNNAKRGGMHVGTLVNIARVLGCHPMELLNLPEDLPQYPTTAEAGSPADLPREPGNLDPTQSCFAQGRSACIARQKRSTNPYRKGTRESGEWNRGYIAEQMGLVAALDATRPPKPDRRRQSKPARRGAKSMQPA